MQIIEQLIAAKTGNMYDCEDAIYLNEHIACVIDGATTKGSSKWDGKTSGQKAAELILSELEGFPEDIVIEKAIEKINKRFQDYYKSKGMLDLVKENPKERLTASFVLYHANRNEIWLVGDCEFMIDGQLHQNIKKVDHILSEVRALVLELALIEGENHEQLEKDDIGRKFILPLLEKQGFLQNHPSSQYGFAVIDGFDVDIDKVVITTVPKGTREIVLASDGFPELKPTLEESEKVLQKVIQEDPLCMRKYKSTKGLKAGNQSFDDRTYLRIRL